MLGRMSEFFFELTPDRVLRAVEQAGFRPTGHCSALTCLENRVYDVRLDDDSHVVACVRKDEIAADTKGDAVRGSS